MLFIAFLIINEYYPRIFPKRAELIESKINDIFKDRWNIVVNRLKQNDLNIPEFKIDYSGTTAYHSKGLLVFPSKLLKKESMYSTFDHEITHYI